MRDAVGVLVSVALLAIISTTTVILPLLLVELKDTAAFHLSQPWSEATKPRRTVGLPCLGSLSKVTPKLLFEFAVPVNQMRNIIDQNII